MQPLVGTAARYSSGHTVYNALRAPRVYELFDTLRV